MKWTCNLHSSGEGVVVMGTLGGTYAAIYIQNPNQVNSEILMVFCREIRRAIEKDLNEITD